MTKMTMVFVLLIAGSVAALAGLVFLMKWVKGDFTGFSETGNSDFGVESAAADKAGEIQEATSFLPDYAFPDSEAAVGTTVSGIVGSAIVAGVAVLICLAGGFFRKKKNAA